MKLKSKVRNIVVGISSGVGAFFMGMPMVYAEEGEAASSDISTVTKPIESLKTLLVGIVGAIGVIILVKNIAEFAQAFQSQDTSTMHAALKGIVAGVIMAGISVVLGFLGF